MQPETHYDCFVEKQAYDCFSTKQLTAHNVKLAPALTGQLLDVLTLVIRLPLPANCAHITWKT